MYNRESFPFMTVLWASTTLFAKRVQKSKFKIKPKLHSMKYWKNIKFDTIGEYC